MATLYRFITDYKNLWRIWLPLLVLAGLAPIFAIATPLLERRIIDNVVLAGDLGPLPLTAALYAGLWVASTIVLLIGGVLRTYLGERLSVQLRQRLFNHAESLSVAFSRREHSGRTMSLFVNDVPSLSGLFSTTVLSGIGSLIALIAGVAVMFRLNVPLAIAAVVGTFLAGGGGVLITRPLRPAARRAQEKAAELNERLQESLTGIREIIAFSREARQASHFRTTLNELLRLRMRVTIIEMVIGSGASILSLVVTLTVFIYGAYLVVQDQTTLGTVIAIRSLFGLLFQPARQLMGLFTGAQKALGAADRIYTFLDRSPAVDDNGAFVLGEISGDVVFERVDFSYNPNQPILQDISFAASAGATIALVGPSGAGKSTLASLLARFYDPDRGRILLDGHDLRDLSLSQVRNEIGFVFQDTFLFAQTIRDNIAFGRQEEATDDEIIAAAQSANAFEFITRLPRGLDTQVGERGVQFSEGQKQRIAIARALLRDPKVLILDEPTSALDARTEHLLQAALNNLMQGRTTFVIAHRLATVLRADHILVLDDGKIVEQGNHFELFEQGGLYRELFDLQFTLQTEQLAAHPSNGIAPIASR